MTSQKNDSQPVRGPIRRRLSGGLTALARAAHRLIHPDYAQERKRFDVIARTLDTTAAVHRKEVADLRHDVAKLAAQLDRQATQKDLRGVDRSLERLRASAGRHYRIMARALKYADWLEQQRMVERRLDNRLARLAASDRPVLIGPWSGEVGFELLYWIPFVTWALHHASVAPERVVVVSRGGAAPWYRHLGGRYFDILSYFPPEDFRSRTEAAKKQKGLGEFDREVVRRLMRAAEIERPHLLHPGLMYRLFWPFWKQQATVHRVEAHTIHRPLPRQDLPELAGRLPSDYVAVRFYFSRCFPDTPENRAFVESVLRSLSDSTEVVLLNTTVNVDDHRDYRPAGQKGIHTVDDLMTPDRNLEVQTAIIAGARAFVGTYGGYSYLAPLCGVSSLAFYSDRAAFFAHHLELAERVFGRLNTGRLIPLDVRSVSLVKLALAPREKALVDLGNR